VAEFPAHLFRMEGDPGSIRSSAAKWSSFGTAATDASAQITGLDTGAFIGPEGDLFRNGLNEDMPRHLTITGDAFGIVSRALATFANTLGDLQDRMRPLAQRAPGLWEALQAAQGRVERAAAADSRHERSMANRPPEEQAADTYHSDSGAASSALSEAQRQWDAAVSQANALRDEQTGAVSTAVRALTTAKDMRFKENPKWWDIGGQFTNFVRDNKDLLQKLSGALKIVSLVAGLLSFIPVLAPIMGPIALGSALLASAIDLSIYAATGEGSLKTILIDVGLNLLPGVGRLARMGAGAMRGTQVARAFSSVTARGRSALSVGRQALANLRGNAIQAVNRVVRLDPIDIGSGDMVLTQTDVALPGLLPLVLSRTHISSYRVGRSFGRSWASTVDQRAEVDDDGVYLATADGMLLAYPLPEDALAVLPQEGPRWPLRHTEDGFQVTDPKQGWTWHFAATDGFGPPLDRPDSRVLPLVAITDRVGHRIELRYADGVLREVTHSGGYVVGVETTGDRITALRLESGNEVRFGYDQNGDLVEVVNGSGAALRFGYDPLGRITRWVDRNGSEYRYTYDPAGRCVATDGTGGRLRGRISYDAERRITTVTDSLGHLSTYELNEHVQVISETDQLGNVRSYTWDRRDHKLSETDPLGRTTRYRYDDEGHLVEVIRPDRARTTAEYNGFGQPTVVTGVDNAVWRRSYDESGNLVEEVDPAGARTTYRYDSDGHLVGMTDPLGHPTRLTTNAAGLVVEAVDARGGTTRYDRDAAGRVTAVTDPVGGVTRYGYTTDGQLAWRTAPGGATDQWEYDGEGNLVAHTDPAGHTTRTEITFFDLPAARTGPDGARLEFGYDTELRLTSVTNPQGLVWRYDYDGAGRLVREVDFNGRVLTYAHDAAGQLVARTNGIGQVVRYVRDLAGNVVEKRSPDAVTRFGYDAVGRLVRAAGPDATLTITRDVLGRVLAEDIDDRWVASEYDLLGRRTRRRTSTGAESVWEYTVGTRPAMLRTAGHELRFEYDAAGREVSRALDGAALALTQEWNEDHRLVAQTVSDARRARLLNRRAYHYRADGYLSRIEDRLGGGRDFDLDPAGRVTAVHAAGWTERYAYDAAGNLTDATVPAGPGQGSFEYAGTLIRRAGTVRFEHDKQGRVVLRQEKQRAEKPRTWRYAWDAEDKLIAVTTPDGQRWRYRYDPLGRRIGKQRIGAGDVVHEQVDFLWDGHLLAGEVHSGENSGENGGRSTAWEYLPGTFTPLTQTEVDRRFYAIVADLTGTPTELVDAEGNLAWQMRTSLWGVPVESRADGVSCPLRFPGQYHDPETGANYNQHRYYEPAVARYQSSDPLGLAAAPNTYSYVSNPHAWIDPLGLSPCAPGGLRGGASFEVDPSGVVTDVRGLGRPDNDIVFSGHGGIGAADTTTVTVPQGTHINFYDAHGKPISDALGNKIETGVNTPAPFETFGPGQQVPDYILSQPTGLTIQGHPITVTGPTRLSEVLQPNMGNTHWAACRSVV